MRVVYINLHSNPFFLSDFSRIISKRKAIDKHRFILNYLLEHDVEVIDYITPGGSMLPGKLLKKMTTFKSVALYEARYVLKHNGIKPSSIQFAFSNDDLKDDDIILFYSHCYSKEKDISEILKGIKIADHIHFYGQEECAAFLKMQNIEYYTCETRLDKYCDLYKKQYSWFKGKYINRKFSYQARFQNTIRFKDRKCKAFAVGTLTYYDGPEFVSCYGTNVYQPKRKMIFDNKDYLSDEIDSYISEYNEVPLKKVNKGDLLFVKLYKKIFNMKNVGRQIKYFSFDIVKKYNEYKMFICPEDALGQYGIGVIEGMACGTAMIGWNYGVYEELGLKGGIHYIPYDGTVEDLKSKIQYYQRPENQDELESIALTGCKYVREKFSQEVIAKEYYDNLVELAKNKGIIECLK